MLPRELAAPRSLRLRPLVVERNAGGITRRRWLATFCAACGALLAIGCEQASPVLSKSQSPATTADPLVAAIDWLASRQQADGGWHSANYAQLRNGAALTPLVRIAVESQIHTAEGLRRCPGLHLRPLGFIRQHVSAAGSLGADDPELLEYPNYATSLALQCLVAENDPTDKPLIARMTAYLVGQQYCEATGFGPEHPAYGGWGFGGPRPVGGSPGHMDIGHTRHVLQALRAAGHKDAAMYARAERFLRLVQKHPTEDRPQPSLAEETPERAGSVSDRSRLSLEVREQIYDGGFYFSPVVLAANKGGVGWVERSEAHADKPTTDRVGLAGSPHPTPYFRSYATATCDGILALLACGVPRDDERIRAAIGWLEKHPNLHYPEGVPKDSNENWGASIQFYHYAVRAECYRALHWPGPWESDLQSGLRMEQRADGSFVNRAGFLMKEDDPILCTALAVIAMSAADAESLPTTKASVEP
ncbi:MAG: hypothetical protein C0483_02205 [Pirellula sp.]|nr:hypothetical protein [Pirellula sp.]